MAAEWTPCRSIPVLAQNSEIVRRNFSIDRFLVVVVRASRCALLDPLLQGSLSGPFGTVVVGRSVNRQGSARTTNADLPGLANTIDHCRFRTSSSCFSRFISDGIAPPHFLRQT
jgi:hypothetical protein